MKNNITIEQLAERLDGKLWTKGEMKRIYLDEGYNTKKMTTKTYVYQREDGSFGVSCNIDCPSQAWQWIKSQQNEIIERVNNQIERAMSDTAFVLVNKDGQPVNYKGEIVALNYAESFYTEREAQEELDNYAAYDRYITMPREEFETEVDRLDEIEAAERAATPAPIVSTVALAPKPVENSTNQKYGVGTKVKHAKFGEGEVTAENEKIIEVAFASETKKLLVDYVKLEII
jgi:hypothetical protein